MKTRCIALQILGSIVLSAIAAVASPGDLASQQVRSLSLQAIPGACLFVDEQVETLPEPIGERAAI
jgi:hypothetical protein